MKACRGDNKSLRVKGKHDEGETFPWLSNQTFCFSYGELLAFTSRVGIYTVTY